MAGLTTQAAADSVLATVSERQVHIMYAGQSHDIGFGALDIGDTSTDGEIKNAVARHFEIPVSKLTFFAVDRHENGNLTVRPQAVFG